MSNFSRKTVKKFTGGRRRGEREIVSRIPINIIDRIISVFAGFGIAYVMGNVVNKVGKSGVVQ